MSNYPIKSPRKLIEVALPLDAINESSAAEKKIKAGKPTNFHLWWARRPLAAARAVIFAQLVNDPGFQQGTGFKYGRNKKEAAVERKRLFKIIEELVKWENTTNEAVLEQARAEIRRSWREVCELNQEHPQAAELFNPEKLPALHDPFAGGGAIPLEAQRLGFEVCATDLNPLPVLINQAMIDIPVRFSGRPPVNPDIRSKIGGESGSWPGASGLAEDLQYYGQWVRHQAEKRIGNLYPAVTVTPEMAQARQDLGTLVGQQLTVIAWIWARTVRSPNPAFSHVEVPLVSTFILSNKKGKEAYVEPIVQGETYRFNVKVGAPPASAIEGTKVPGRGANFRCIVSDSLIDGSYIKSEGQAGRIGARLIAIVADGPHGRVYISPTENDSIVADLAQPSWQPSGEVPAKLTGGTCVPYGLKYWRDLFTKRQLAALATFSELVTEAGDRILADAKPFMGDADEVGLEQGGRGSKAYAESLMLYLTLALSRMSDWGNSLARWESKAQVPQQLFGKQSIPMVWDFCEANPLSTSTGSYHASLNNINKSFRKLPSLPVSVGFAAQADAQTQSLSHNKVVSTDPPYYDNIAYADLSDFFYSTIRHVLKPVFPRLLATLTTPKTEELVAASYRHAGDLQAEEFFLNGMTNALRNLSEQAHPAFPVTIYYAFKQSETKSGIGTSSTGWETFLAAMHAAGLEVTSTWPIRTEMTNKLASQTHNMLASSIVLSCRKRSQSALTISRREFVRELNAILPQALDEMTKGSGEERSPIAPVDLSQAIIGPGMAVFSKYAAVLEADGSPMNVRTALQLINRFLAEDDFDADTQFCLHWFEEHGWSDNLFDKATVLARSKSTSVDAMKEAGVLHSGGGKVRLLKWAEYPAVWDPRTDKRTPVWEALHQLIRSLKSSDGEGGAGALLAALGGKAEAVRQLAYRLYTLCEREGRAEDARAYNELITSWTGIESAAASAPAHVSQGQTEFEY